MLTSQAAASSVDGRSVAQSRGLNQAVAAHRPGDQRRRDAGRIKIRMGTIIDSMTILADRQLAVSAECGEARPAIARPVQAQAP